MLEHSILAFTALAVMVVLMPGADTVLVLNASLRDGARAGMVTATGVVCGPILWGALAGLGVALLLNRNSAGFTAVAAAGGLYLCFLATRSFSAARSSWRLPAANSGSGEVPCRQRPLAHFLTGLTTNVLNPKIGVFYLSVMPALFVGQQITIWLGAMLGMIHAGVGMAFLTGVAALSGFARRRLNHPRFRASIEIICATSLLGFGVYALTHAALASAAIG